MTAGHRRWKLALGAGSVCITAAMALAVLASSPVSAQVPRGVQISVGEIHPTPIVPGARARTDGPPTDAECLALYNIDCYGPTQLETAYDLQPLFAKGIDGAGQTIVIVDAYGSPTASQDLDVFDQAYGLPAPPSFTVIQPAGKVKPYKATPLRIGWAGETDLDVEYAHAMAPGANILLVETPANEDEGTSGFAQIETAEKYVVNHHLGGVISQSFSATEQSFPSASALLALRGAYQDAARQGVTVLAASGDTGVADVGADGHTYFDFPVTSWPDSDPLVTGIGGTQLHLNADGTKSEPDTVWNDTYDSSSHRVQPLAGGGGLSVIFGRPSYQRSVRSVVGNQRGVPDISMSGSCSGAVNEYQGFAGQTGWFPVCGTSEATPLFSGIVALADQVAGHPLGLINSALYQLSGADAPGIVDVTTGNNSVTFHQHGVHIVTGYTALPGYDLASGVGTVDPASFVPELAAAAG